MSSIIDKSTGEIRPAAIRPVMDTLRHLRGGVMLDDAGDALAEVVRAVVETGRPGRVTIDLQIRKVGRSGALSIIDKVTSKVPQNERIDTLMFPTEDGNLLTKDPRQNNLDLRTVEVPSAAALDVKQNAG